MRFSTLVRLAVLTAVAAALAALFVVTYLHITAGVPAKPQQPRHGEDYKEAQLRFPELDRAGAEEAAREVEWHQDARRSYRFENPKDGPVKVALEKRACKCTKVEIAVTDEPAGPPAGKTDVDGGLTWNVLEPGGDWFTMPGRAGGVVRLTWNGTTLGAQRITAVLKTEADGAAGVPCTLEVPVIFVRPLMAGLEAEMASPAPSSVAEVGEMRADEPRGQTARFVCWSATRDRFSLEGGPTGHPCVTVGPPERLSDDEVARLRRAWNKSMRCAYRVEVTVRPRADGGDRLSLGPFRFPFSLKSDAVGSDETAGYVSGVVRGEVTVGGPDDHDRLDFGSFPADEERTRVIDLTADGGFPDLEVDRQEMPRYLRVTLTAGPAGPGRSWRLKAMFVPNGLVGEFPADDRVIVLKGRTEQPALVAGWAYELAAPPRRVNVPTVGNAYVR
jgi:hypothetical protein